MEQTVKQRIKTFMNHLNIGQRKFEMSVGLSNGYINSLRKSPSADKIQMIIDTYPQLNIDWLLSGEGEMLKSDTPTPEISYTDGVPYFNEDFMLGFDELIAPNSANPEYLIRMPGYEKATLWCNASGHSMEPEISNGDIIALRRIEDISFLPFGDIYGFVTTNGMRTIKRLGRSSKPDHYRLIPTNKDYDEQDIPVNKILIAYRVMGAMKPF